MKEKHLQILAGVFVFLLIVYFVTRPRHTSVRLDEFVQSIVIGVAKDDIKMIEVYKETSSDQPVRMIFAKQEGQWRIPTHYYCKAQKSRMDRLLDDVLEMTGKVRSSDPKHFEKYQITDEQGIHFILKDETGKTLANLIVGKRAEDYNTGFVRFAGKEKVYFVDKNILSSLNIHGEIDTLSQFKDDSFVDLQAVDEDKETLEVVGMVTGGRRTVIQKVEKEVEVMNEDSTKAIKIETEWVLVRGKSRRIKLDQKEVNNFLRDVTKIRAQDVVDRIGSDFEDLNKRERYGVRRPGRYLIYEDSDGPRETVLLGREYEKDKGYYMQVRSDGLVYKLSRSTYDKIFKWMDELPKKTAK